MTNQQPDCCLCGQPCEPWPTGGGDRIYGYGNNPDPLGNSDTDRCCNTCNDTEVIPARLGRFIATDSRPTTDDRIIRVREKYLDMKNQLKKDSN